MKNIAIYGAGGFGREIACLIKLINAKEKQWNLVGFFDDKLEKGTQNEYGVILGDIDVLNSYTDELGIVLAIGNPNKLNDISRRISNKHIFYPNIIAPDVNFLDKESCCMGVGNVFCSNTVVSCNISIGKFNLFNIGVILGHDVSIGNYNIFNPAVRISGNVVIEHNNFFGVSSVVIQQKKIGSNVVIGANSVIIRNTINNSTYVGNPATKLI